LSAAAIAGGAASAGLGFEGAAARAAEHANAAATATDSTAAGACGDDFMIPPLANNEVQTRRASPPAKRVYSVFKYSIRSFNWSLVMSLVTPCVSSGIVAGPDLLETVGPPVVQERALFIQVVELGYVVLTMIIVIVL